MMDEDWDWFFALLNGVTEYPDCEGDTIQVIP